MDHQNGRYARLRYTATGALAALAAAGAIAGTVAVAANPRAKTRGHAAVAKTRAHAAVANGSTTKTPTPPGAGQDPRATAELRSAVLDRRPAARQRRHDQHDRGPGP